MLSFVEGSAALIRVILPQILTIGGISVFTHDHTFEPSAWVIYILCVGKSFLRAQNQVCSL